MRHYFIYILALTACLTIAGCSDDDGLAPSYADKNRFMATDSATNAVSALRNKFYWETGSYLLFNDTLRHEAIGTDAAGIPLYANELLDVSYVMASNAQQTAFKYQYLTLFSDMEQGVTFLKTYILPHLGPKLRPFSWLLVSHITRYTVSDNVYSYDAEPQCAVGNRATALALDVLDGADDKGMQTTAAGILVDLLSTKVAQQPAKALNTFTQYSAAYYNHDVAEPHYDDDANMQDMYNAGFIDGYYSWGFLFYGHYPTQSDDIASFVNLALTKTEQEVSTQYTNYPTIITKYQAMRQLLTDLGYVY